MKKNSYNKGYNNNIFLNNNPYGFKLNINNKEINKLYRRYKEWKGYSPLIPLTNEQRYEFENYILNTKAFKLMLKK